MLPPTVLLVDDDPEFLTSAVHGLRGHHLRFTAETAINGFEAIAVLERQMVDLVITDLKMPVLDGFALLKAMNTRFPGTPVIVVSALRDATTEARMIDSGASAFIEKPVDFARLAELVELQLARSAAGFVRGISLPSLLQLLATERRSCSVRLAFSAGAARLYFDGGVLVHVEAAEKVGEEALFELLADQEIAWIEIEAPRRPAKVTVARSLPHLLLEAARLGDEANRPPGSVPSQADTFDFMTEEDLEEAPDQDLLPDEPELGELVQLALKRAGDIPNLSSAAVVELGRGRILGATGVQAAELSERARAIAEILRGMVSVRHRLGPAGDADELMLSSRPQTVLARLLPTAPHTFLMLCFEFANPNLGLARLELREISRELDSGRVAVLTPAEGGRRVPGVRP